MTYNQNYLVAPVLHLFPFVRHLFKFLKAAFVKCYIKNLTS